jgi:hypothetical protein
MSNLIDTQGTQLLRGDGAASEAFTLIPRITKAGPFPIATGRPLRDVTDLSHTDTRKHKPGLADMPEITAEGWFDPDDAQHAGLIADYVAKTERNFRASIPTSPAKVYEFSAWVMLEIGEITVDGDYPMTITLKPQSLLTEV